MSAWNWWRASLAGLLLVGFHVAARAQTAPATPDVTNVLDAVGIKGIQQEDDRWGNFLTDTSATSVSAAGMLGITGESVANIENVRNLTVALQGLASNDSGQTLGLSITPARTSLAPMNLADYAQTLAMRLLGSLTLSYAQGPITIEDVEYKRNAYAIDANYFIFDKDDPVIAYGLRVPKCDLFGETASGDAAPSGPPGGAPSAGDGNGPRPAGDASAEETAAVGKRIAKCHQETEAALRWNRSQISLSYGDAHIQLKDNSKPEESLGRTLAVSFVYGFDGVRYFEENYALTVSYRHSNDEPVLATLAQPTTVFKDSSLFVARLTGGSRTSRVFLEFSNARSHDITASQRAFKQALGIDYRLLETAWLNVRVGKQRTVNGTDSETGTLFTVSYSPQALLKH